MSIFYKGIAGRRAGKARGVVIHNDAGSQYANAAFYRGFLRSHMAENGFAHVYIASDGRYQPENYNNCAWHTANSIGNYWYVGWEVCQSMGDANTFLNNEQKVFKDVAKYMHSVGMKPNSSTVKLHREFSSTSCPHRSWALHGQAVEAVRSYFIAGVKKYYNNSSASTAVSGGGSTSSSSTKSVSKWNKKQSVDVNKLQVHKSANTSSKVVAVFKKGHTFTASKIVRGGANVNGYTTWFLVGDGEGKGGYVTGAYVTEVKVKRSSKNYNAGDKVKLLTSAKKYQTKENIPASVKGKMYTVKQSKKVNQSKSVYAVLLKEVNSWVLTQDVSLVKAAAKKKTSSSSTNASSGQKIHLPASAATWNVYPLSKAPVVGNQCGKLAPSRYGGLSYNVLRWSQTNVAVISTSAFGQVQIFVGSGTGAKITGTTAAKSAKKATTAAKKYSGGKTVTLPKSVAKWGIYKKGVQPVSKNIFAYVYPKKFGGLKYNVIKWTYPNVALIKTSDYGEVQIFVGKGTGAKIK